jgi:hypothetical protein
MLRSMVSRAPPVALGLVLVCAMAVPNIKATTDAAVKIVRRMRFPPFPAGKNCPAAALSRKQAESATVPLARQRRGSCGNRRDGEVGKRRATRPSIALFSFSLRKTRLDRRLRRARRPPCSRNSNTSSHLSSQHRRSFELKEEVARNVQPRAVLFAQHGEHHVALDDAALERRPKPSRRRRGGTGARE